MSSVSASSAKLKIETEGKKSCARRVRRTAIGNAEPIEIRTTCPERVGRDREGNGPEEVWQVRQGERQEHDSGVG